MRLTISEGIEAVPTAMEEEVDDDDDVDDVGWGEKSLERALFGADLMDDEEDEPPPPARRVQAVVKQCDCSGCECVETRRNETTKDDNGHHRRCRRC